MCGDVALKTALPISRDRAVDDRGIEGGDGVVVEPEPGHHARAELLDDHIGAFQQGVQPGPLGGIFQVEGDAPLAAIEKREAGTVVPPIGRMAAHLLAASGPLDLHDLRAGFGQQQGRQRPRQQRREVEDE